MANVAPRTWEMAKVEYEQALSQYQNCTVLRRQDMVFVTTVQAAVLTIVGSQLSDLSLSGVLLSLIAFFLLLLGLNSERRLSHYMKTYSQRASEIESEFGMSLVASGTDEIRKKRFLFSNSKVFPIYYLFFMVAWMIIWLKNCIT